MTSQDIILPLLVFEAAGCMMAVPASEVVHLDTTARCTGTVFTVDLDEYFADSSCDGPWLHWTRGTLDAWLRVRQVIDVVPVAIATLTPMPALLTAQHRTGAFVASGARHDDVFLLLDPARLFPRGMSMASV
jgi:hypothetical protein